MTSPSPRDGAPAGRRISPRLFWLVVVLFAIANTAAWVWYDRAHRIRQRDALAVTACSFEDNEVIDARRPALSWTFNMDIAPPTPGVASLDPAVITPALAGEWKWASPRNLVFIPRDDLPRATRFSVSLQADRLKSVDGFVLPKSTASTFQTPALSLIDVRQTRFMDDDTVVLEMEFSDPVLPADVLRHLTLRADTENHSRRRVTSESRPVALQASLYGDHAPALTNGSRIVRVRTSLAHLFVNTSQREMELTVELAKGLAGTSGPLGIEEPITRKLDVAGALIATDVDTFSPRERQPSLRLNFNNPVRVEDLTGLITVDPPVEFSLSSNGSESVDLHGDFSLATRYTVKIAAGPAVDVKKYPRPATFSVFVQDRDPATWFVESQGYLGAHGNRTILAKSVNTPAIMVSAERVYDNNLVAWRTFFGGYGNNLTTPIASKRLLLKNVKNKVEDVPLSLDDLLPNDQPIDGAYRISIHSVALAAPGNTDFADYCYGATSMTVTVSDIGLTAKQTTDGKTSGVIAWAVSLSTAKPLPGVTVRAFSSKNQAMGEAVTDENGVARIDNIVLPKDERLAVLLAERTEDTKKTGLTWLDLTRSQRDMGAFDTAGAPYHHTGYDAFLYTDRGVYRPGEIVVLRSIVRGPGLTKPDAFPVRFTLRRPDGRVYRHQALTLDKDGAIEWRVSMPEDLPTGRWSVSLGLPGDEKSNAPFGHGSFQLEEFMPDRMKVAVTIGDGVGATMRKTPEVEGRISLPDAEPAYNLLICTQAEYLFGQPAANLKAELEANTQAMAFSANDFSDYAFGDSANAGSVFGGTPVSGNRFAPPAITLAANGAGKFEIALRPAPPAAITTTTGAPEPVAVERPPASAAPPASAYAFKGPWKFHATVSVIETGGRGVSGHASKVLDELPYYLGLRAGNVRLDAPSPVNIALVTPAGKLATVDRSLKLTVYRETWNNTLLQSDGRYRYNSTRVLTPVKRGEQTVSVTAGKGTASIKISESGSYVLQAYDPKTQQVTTVPFYVYRGGGGWDDNVSRQHPDRLEVAIARESGKEEKGDLEIGETVKAIVRSPFKGTLLLTIETDRVLETHVQPMDGNVAEVALKLPEGCAPNAYLCATVVRGVDPKAKWRTHRAFGATRFTISRASRELNVALTAPTEIRPGTTLDVAIRVTDASGAPVPGAAVALVAVDDGICRITNFATPNPLAHFWATRALGVRSSDLYAELMPEIARPAGNRDVGGDGGGGEDGRHLSTVSAKRVRPVALVHDILHADAEGNAAAHFQVPAFLGQLRVMAVAYSPDKLGSAATPVLVRAPVIAQSSFPRFAAPGDSFDVPVTVFNNTDKPGEAKLSLLLSGHWTLDTGHSLSVPAHGQATHVFHLQAPDATGVTTANISVALNSETFHDAAVELPIRPAAPIITHGDYQIVSPDKPYTFTIANPMLAGTASLNLQVTPRPTLNLPRGLEYLERYPYGCLEQTTSKCFPLVYLSDIGETIAPGVADKDRVAAKVQHGITRLLGMTTPDGGLAMWPGDYTTWQWGTVYAAHFLVEADAAGHKVPADLTSRVLDYCRTLLTRSEPPGDMTETQAYACYVLALSGKPDRVAMNRLSDVINADSSAAPDLAPSIASARFFLSAAQLASGRKDRAAATMLPQNLPTPRTTRQLGGNVGSAIRDQALMLNTLLAIQPDHPQIHTLARSLADAGRHGRWTSTHDTAWAVMALGHYLRATKNEAPFTSAELWQNGKKLATTDAATRSLTWTTLPTTDAPFELRVQGDAASRAHLTWSLTGVPATPPADVDYTIKVRRTYLSADGKPLPSLEVASGTLVKVLLTIDTPTPIQNMVIEDLLPAGLEIENPRLVTSAAGPADPTNAPRPLAPTRLDMRDDRLILVAHAPATAANAPSTYIYLTRAVTPGTYTIPPTRAEAMYDISINSLANTKGKLVVKPQ